MLICSARILGQDQQVAFDKAGSWYGLPLLEKTVVGALLAVLTLLHSGDSEKHAAYFHTLSAGRSNQVVDPESQAYPTRFSLTPVGRQVSAFGSVVHQRDRPDLFDLSVFYL